MQLDTRFGNTTMDGTGDKHEDLESILSAYANQVEKGRADRPDGYRPYAEVELETRMDSGSDLVRFYAWNDHVRRLVTWFYEAFHQTTGTNVERFLALTGWEMSDEAAARSYDLVASWRDSYYK